MSSATSVCVHVVGAAAVGSDPRDPEARNNRLQASPADMSRLVARLASAGLACEVVAYDCMYPRAYVSAGVRYVKDMFDLSQLPDRGVHVVVEFCGLFCSDWTCRGDAPPLPNRDNIILFACGCRWNSGFPVDAIAFSVELGFRTPLLPEDMCSYLSVIGYVQLARESGLADSLLPFLRGCHQILGELVTRGYSGNDYKQECVLRELLQCIDCPPALLGFAEGAGHWNALPRDARESMYTLVYGVPSKGSIER